MKNAFEFTLKGKDWFSLWAMFLVPTLLLQGLSLMIKAPADSSGSLGYLGLTLAILYLQVLVTAWFQIPLWGVQLGRLSVGGRGFSFGGDSLEFVKLNALGFLFSVATLGIYLPWYSRKVLAYLAAETRFDGEPAQFLGKPVQLLLILVFGFLAVLGVAIVLLVPVVLFLMGLGQPADGSAGVLTLVTFGLVLLLVGPLLYAIYRWTVHFRWKDLVVRWDTRFWRSTGMILGQSALVVGTVGIYAPAAFLVLYRYFLARTVVEEEGRAVVRLSFDGPLGLGFGLLWGQVLLTVVTLGFYWPWALERIGAWLAAGTKAEVLAETAEAAVVHPL